MMREPGEHLRKTRSNPLPTPNKGVADALADLQDYITNIDLKSTESGIGGEALAFCRKVLVQGNLDHTGHALKLLERLQDRHFEQPGQDIAKQRQETNGPSYLEVLDTLWQEISRLNRQRERGRPQGR